MLVVRIERRWNKWLSIVFFSVHTRRTAAVPTLHALEFRFSFYKLLSGLEESRYNLLPGAVGAAATSFAYTTCLCFFSFHSCT